VYWTSETVGGNGNFQDRLYAVKLTHTTEGVQVSSL
jgi:hypothetical protein